MVESKTNNLGYGWVTAYVARTRPLQHGHDTQMSGKILKMHMTCVSDTRVRHVSGTTRFHDKSVQAAFYSLSD